MTDFEPNPRATPGDNQPPPPDPLDGFTVHVSDLMEEAKLHLDGQAISTQGQADAIATLLDMLRKVGKDADAARAAEKKPHDDAAKRVQERWRGVLNRCDIGIETCKKSLAPWLVKLEADKQKAAQAARDLANQKAAEAAEAIRAADVTDLDAREAAEALVKDANRAGKAATKAEGDKAQAKGGARATTLRSNWVPYLTDPKAALSWYVRTNPEAIKVFLVELAKADIIDGKRTILGFEVKDEPRVV